MRQSFLKTPQPRLPNSGNPRVAQLFPKHYNFFLATQLNFLSIQLNSVRPYLLHICVKHDELSRMATTRSTPIPSARSRASIPASEYTAKAELGGGGAKLVLRPYSLFEESAGVRLVRYSDSDQSDDIVPCNISTILCSLLDKIANDSGTWLCLQKPALSESRQPSGPFVVLDTSLGLYSNLLEEKLNMVPRSTRVL